MGVASAGLESGESFSRARHTHPASYQRAIVRASSGGDSSNHILVGLSDDALVLYRSSTHATGVTGAKAPTRVEAITLILIPRSDGALLVPGSDLHLGVGQSECMYARATLEDDEHHYEVTCWVPTVGDGHAQWWRAPDRHREASERWERQLVHPMLAEVPKDPGLGRVGWLSDASLYTYTANGSELDLYAGPG